MCIAHRYVKDLEAIENTVGLYQIPNTTADTLFKIVKDVLLRLDISLDACRGEQRSNKLFPKHEKRKKA